MEISNWFKGFEKGLARLSPEERSAFFSECGKNCVNGGTQISEGRIRKLDLQRQTHSS